MKEAGLMASVQHEHLLPLGMVEHIARLRITLTSLLICQL